MQNKPSNTREQCAFDSGAFKARMIDAKRFEGFDRARARDDRNPHKKGSVEHKFWNEGFDSV